ncbi:DsbC family protein [Lampropedia puyangensis]|uniref:Thiol:disulfide interchange protein n=1 Tax=Lampropedia puyangensis TaxID=1330072 RepID=A0A4S8EVC0_9BURK|nr:DsbC family protein [Lampropedia puyangensis]THT98418.1 DsbC family protein [Lampropedia puyangensis]
MRFKQLPLHLCLAVAGLGNAYAVPGNAPEAVRNGLKQAIETHSQGQVSVSEINTSPIEGVYEIVTNNDVFYSDRAGRYAFIEGRLVDMQNRIDMTQERLVEVNRIPFDDLPLHLAIKEVRGNGSRTFAVFEDALCPICQVFTKFIDQLDDVTIYRFPFPVISKDSAGPARVAWCSADKAATWHATMNGSRPQGDQTCDVSGLVDILKVGEKYEINSTPTVVLLNGKRLVGATPPEQFIDEINKSVKQ